jgi:hypothetical protein
MAESVGITGEVKLVFPVSRGIDSRPFEEADHRRRCRGSFLGDQPLGKRRFREHLGHAEAGDRTEQREYERQRSDDGKVILRHYFFPMHHRCLKVRMKMSPLEIASEEFVFSPLPSLLTASTSNFGLAARTTVAPLRMRT